MTDAALLTDGIWFGEGPRWHDGRLWFSDFHAHAVRSASLAGELRTEVEIDDRPSGLGWMPDRSLLIVSMHKRQLLRRTPDGAVRLHADLSALAAFPCNDMVVDAAGRAYVGNFGFDLDAPAAKPDRPSTMLIAVEPDGRAHVAAEGLVFPNGAVITADGRTLIVAETLAQRLTAFTVAEDGSLTDAWLWAATAPRLPDGIALDAEGAIWIANPAAAECVRLAEGGAVLDVVATTERCFACALGGDDGHTLFMLTAPTAAASGRSETPLGKLRVATVAVPRAGA